MRDLSAGAGRPGKCAGAGPAWRNELSGEVHGPAIQAQAIHGDLYVGGTPRARMPVPSQLLAPPAAFTGRSNELAALGQLATDPDAPQPAAVLVVIVGVGGVGKSSLASYWLHQVRARFPGGHLYAELGGHQQTGPVRPGDVLGRFLRALGTPPEQVPPGLAEQAALWRSLTNGQRLAIMLDSAASASQVRALLPGPGASLVVVTARRRLAGLAIDGARFVEVGPLDEASAVELLARIAGPGRVGSEPGAAREVVRLCGLLPLAVCVSAARLASHPRWPIERVAAELAEERHRLTALALTDDVSVRAVFDISCQALPSQAARLYRLAALIPGPDFGPDLAAAATAADPARAARLLEVLAEASLLEETGERRFRFHDLVRLHAREQADTETLAVRQAVVAASVDWYLRAAVAADLAVIPGRWRLGPVYDQARRAAAAYSGPAVALGWLDAGLPGLVAAVRAAHDHGLDQQAWQLCEALWGLFAYRKYYQPWVEVHCLGLASARACGDRRAEARMRLQLGLAHLSLGQHQRARRQFTRALALDRREGHRLGEASALEQIGVTDLAQGRPAEAIASFTRARAIHQQIGRARGIAGTTRHIGEAHRDAGRYDQAESELAGARRLFAALPDRYNEARSLTSTGQTRILAGRPAGAVQPLREALAIMASLGAGYEQARIHTALASAAAALGDPGRARAHLGQALVIYDQIGAPEAAGARRALDALGPGPAGVQAAENDNGAPAS